MLGTDRHSINGTLLWFVFWTNEKISISSVKKKHFNILTPLKLGYILQARVFYYLIGSILPYKWHLRVDETQNIKSIAKIDTPSLCS